MTPVRLATTTTSSALLRRSLTTSSKATIATPSRLAATTTILHPARAPTPVLLPRIAVNPSSPRQLHTTAPRSLLKDSQNANKTPTDWAQKGAITYEELKPITEAPTGDITLIDVREPSETSQGMIPSAVNVPLSTFPVAFKSSSSGGDFNKNFAFPRPEFGQKLVVYCRSGKRSQQALEELRKEGWGNVRNYTGSWLDWGKQEEKRGREED